MYLRLLTLLAVAATFAQAAPPTEWDWIAPQPHRQTWVDLVSGTNGFVALTDGYGGRQIYDSADGNQWELAQVPVNAGLRRLKFLNGNYVAVGKCETILTSPDGYDWQVRTTNTAGLPLFDIAYGNGVYVAVGYNSAALWSKDLKIWSAVEFPPGYSLLNVEFGNGVFIAVANSGKIYRSADGRVWTDSPWPESLRSSPSDYQAGLAFNNGVFVFSAYGGTAVSSDALNWTFTTKVGFKEIVAAGSGFIASTGDRVAVSSDGATWQTVVSLTLPDSPSSLFNCAARFGDRWFAAGYMGLLYTSTNGLDWSAVINPVDYSHPHIAYANGRFIRYGAEAGQFISSDGADWNFNASAPDLTTLVGGNGVAVGITSENKAAISSDGTNWQEFALPAQASGRLLFGKDTFVVAGDAGVMLSHDGKTWDVVPIPGIKSIRLIGFENSTFAAISDSYQPMTSADGRTWTIQPAQIDAIAQFYAAGNGRFVGITTGAMGVGSVTYSTDGAHWQRQQLHSGSTYSYTGLEFGAGYFLAIDGQGEIFYSTNGVDWLGERQAPQPFTGAAYGNGVWVVVGGDSVLRSSDRATAQSVATLQLTKTNFTTWNLLVSGSPGERWEIQSSPGLATEWTPLQTVEIPTTGKILVPLSLENNAGFFRAAIQP